VFDSKKEAKRWAELQALQFSGVITDLQRQVKFVLIPTQREPDTIGKRGGIRQGKTIEKECAYYADFTYKLADTSELVVEDAKGVRTPEYKIKRKLMLYVHHIRIKEV
jgi:hypothetical protein